MSIDGLAVFQASAFLNTRRLMRTNQEIRKWASGSDGVDRHKHRSVYPFFQLLTSRRTGICRHGNLQSHGVWRSSTICRLRHPQACAAGIRSTGVGEFSNEVLPLVDAV